MTRSLQHGPSQARPIQPQAASGTFATSLRHSAHQRDLPAFEDDSLDDPNLQRIDAFMADDGSLDETSDEI